MGPPLEKGGLGNGEKGGTGPREDVEGVGHWSPTPREAAGPIREVPVPLVPAAWVFAR